MYKPLISKMNGHLAVHWCTKYKQQVTQVCKSEIHIVLYGQMSHPTLFLAGGQMHVSRWCTLESNISLMLDLDTNI